MTARRTRPAPHHEGRLTVRYIDGRRHETRAELAARHSLSPNTLSRYWAARDTNGHPPAVRIERTLHWPSREFDQWLGGLQAEGAATTQPTPKPEGMGGPAEFARICGHSTTHTVMDWVHNPPQGFPAPDHWHELPSGRKRPYWQPERMTAWAEHGRGPRGQGKGNPGRPRSQPHPYAGDPRLALARQVLAENPGATTTDLVRLMVQRYPEHYSKAAWTSILTTARQHPTEE
ncbi:hypothetical protein [Streptomyces chrestomyceticus]|uniref:hypothetical protein n=1 Tax=Streptomyces chrestomyceticus TaxID=68185 RepID=UPI0033F4DED3